MNKQPTVKESNLTLISREKLAVSGVEDVISFDEKGATLRTSLGELNIDGENIRIGDISIEQGTLSLTGKVNGIYYTAPTAKKRKGLFGKN